MKNLLLVLSLFAFSGFYSQTVITDTLNCQGGTTTLTYTGSNGMAWICDSIVDAHMFLVNFPQNPNDSIQTWWDVNFSFITVEPISFTFPPYMFTESGCYRFNVVLDCISGGTLTLSSTWYVSTVGIEENILPGENRLVRVVDPMGRDAEPKLNEVRLFRYADGVTVRILKTE